MLYDSSLTFFFVILNGFFVAAEFAIVKVRYSQLELKARNGNKIAELSQNILLQLDAYLSATQLGITLASLGLGWIGEGVVTRIILNLFSTFNTELSASLAHSIALPVAFLFITFLHIVFGELAPKSMAIQKSEQVTLLVAIPLRFFCIIFKPFILILNFIANKLIQIIGFQAINEEGALHSPDELRYLIKESSESGLISEADQELLENVFDFSHTEIKSIMVPRNQIFAIENTLDLNQIIDKTIEEGFSRIPVYDKTLDNIIGIIYSKDLINLIRYPNLFVLFDLIRPIVFVSEDDQIKNTLNLLKKNKIHLAIVQDEFGGTKGLVTLEDIIEEIIGDIQDEFDDETSHTEAETLELIYNAQIRIDELNEELDYKIPESELYETLHGYITNYIGRLPEIDEEFQLPNYNVKILEYSNNVAKKIQLIPIQINED